MNGGGTRSIPTRLRAAGYASYAEYLGSPHWADVKQRFKSSGLNKHKCACCQSKPWRELHHRTYVRLGAERLTDLVPVCRDCHETIHRRVRDSDSPPGQALYDVSKQVRNEGRLRKRAQKRRLKRERAKRKRERKRANH